VTFQQRVATERDSVSDEALADNPLPTRPAHDARQHAPQLSTGRFEWLRISYIQWGIQPRGKIKNDLKIAQLPNKRLSTNRNITNIVRFRMKVAIAATAVAVCALFTVPSSQTATATNKTCTGSYTRCLIDA
jgi:hypothetical protein